MRIALLVDDPALPRSLRARLPATQGGDRPPAFLPLPSWPQLLGLAEAGGCDLALLDPCLGSGVAHRTPELQSLCRLASSLGRDRIILLLPEPCRGPRSLHDLGAAGFRYLVVKGVEDDPRHLLRVFARAETRRVLESAPGVWPRQPPDSCARTLLLDSLTGWPPQTRVPELAFQMTLSIRALYRTLAEARLPTPGRCLAWALLLEAATLKEWGAGSRDRIARLLDLGGGDDLAHRSGRVTGRPLAEVWSQDPVASVAQLLVKDLARTRKGA